MAFPLKPDSAGLTTSERSILLRRMYFEYWVESILWSPKSLSFTMATGKPKRCRYLVSFNIRHQSFKKILNSLSKDSPQKLRTQSKIIWKTGVCTITNPAKFESMKLCKQRQIGHRFERFVCQRSPVVEQKIIFVKQSTQEVITIDPQSWTLDTWKFHRKYKKRRTI